MTKRAAWCNLLFSVLSLASTSWQPLLSHPLLSLPLLLLLRRTEKSCHTPSPTRLLRILLHFFLLYFFCCIIVFLLFFFCDVLLCFSFYLHGPFFYVCCVFCSCLQCCFSFTLRPLFPFSPLADICTCWLTCGFSFCATMQFSLLSLALHKNHTLVLPSSPSLPFTHKQQQTAVQAQHRSREMLHNR